MIEIYRKVHDAGLTYNDLKLDNILIGDEKNIYSSLHQVKLCDFGFAGYFRKSNGEHKDPKSTDRFKSNMLFASVN